jgi:hypothetical protein
MNPKQRQRDNDRREPRQQRLEKNRMFVREASRWRCHANQQ